MRQVALLDEAQRIVNVASVPQRSPFRYPGGKTWLVPRVREWLTSRTNRPTEFIEPFAGGGIVSLTVAFEQLAERVTMVELDENVAAVWSTILGGDAGWLADQIIGFELSDNAVETTLSKPPSSRQERAFQTIIRNRINRGGILAPGAGKVKHGENGKGLTSRWYPKTLKKRILDIAEMAERITFKHGDGMEIIEQYAGDRSAVFFIDPPYTASGKRAGTRLYTHNQLDHEALFELSARVAGDFLMTYDDASEVRDLARRHGFDTRAIPMKNTHHAEMTELLIGRSLEWLKPTVQLLPLGLEGAG